MEICKELPANVFWVLRRFIKKWVPFDKYGAVFCSVNSPQAVVYPEDLYETPVDLIKEMGEKLIKEKSIKNRPTIVLLLDSPREDNGQLLPQR